MYGSIVQTRTIARSDRCAGHNRWQSISLALKAAFGDGGTGVPWRRATLPDGHYNLRNFSMGG